MDRVSQLSSNFMYDILQLNDMLVPELIDIANQQKNTGEKKLYKQELVCKILDKQAVEFASEAPPDPNDDGKTKRKTHYKNRHRKRQRRSDRRKRGIKN